MSARARVLLLDANGWGGWRMVASETVARGMLGLRSIEDVPRIFRSASLVRRALRDRYAALSYAVDWRDALVASERLAVDTCNILNLIEYARFRRRIPDYDLIVALHSATGDSMSLLRRTAHWLERRTGKLVVFVGNEYNLLESKLAFLRETGAEFVASQLPLESAQWLYAECGASVLPMPHALNPAIYRRLPELERDIDLGFIGARYSLSIGDTERSDAVDRITARARNRGFTTDVRHVNVPRDEWVRFLNRCRGVVGAEAGTRYLDRAGTLIPAVEAWLRRHPQASFSEVFERFFANRGSGPSGKAISSRHFEPIGTLTCQVLLEGEYNGILRAGEHYIPVRPDFGNLDEALARFREESASGAMARRTLEYALSAHTYAHRVRELLRRVLGASAA